MISHNCPHGRLFSCKVCEFGDRSGYLELELGPSRAVEPDEVSFFECGPRHPGALVDLEDLLSREEQRAAVSRYLGHPAEEDLLPSAAQNYAFSEALKEKLLSHLLGALACLPPTHRPLSLTLFAWAEGSESLAVSTPRSWASAFLGSDEGQILGAVDGYRQTCGSRAYYGNRETDAVG